MEPSSNVYRDFKGGEGGDAALGSLHPGTLPLKL